MVSHFSTIGMPVKSNEEMLKLIKTAAMTSKKILCDYGHYLKWSSENGAELWTQINKSDEIIGVNPFYNGVSNFSVGIMNRLERENYNSFEGLLYAWSNPKNNEPDMGDYPLAFDCVNIAEMVNVKYPFIANIKLVAFAHELQLYISEEDYHKKQKKNNGEHYYASKSFIPSGTFSADDESEEKFEIKPEAIFTGKIIDFKELYNELTGKKYLWIKTETYGGIIDVVIDPELVTEEIKINGIISGVFYLCGKIII